MLNAATFSSPNFVLSLYVERPGTGKRTQVPLTGLDRQSNTNNVRYNRYCDTTSMGVTTFGAESKFERK